jgi:hypothetical protein
MPFFFACDKLAQEERPPPRHHPFQTGNMVFLRKEFGQNDRRNERTDYY